MKDTIPEVFIIESLRFEDETEGDYEGQIISSILRLNRKDSKYFYIRTKKELRTVLEIFSDSSYRYLHISCHANGTEMATTLDMIPFPDLSRILRPHLKHRRLFVSACEMANQQLANHLLPGSDCFSLMGPAETIAFSDAAITWASFYHLMFNHTRDVMKRDILLHYGQQLSTLFGVPLNLYWCSNRGGKIHERRIQRK
jgi:hypothetical protein